MKKNKLYVSLRGGIGNQLFIYSAARAIALNNDAELVIDKSSGFSKDYLYKREYQLDYFNVVGRDVNKLERILYTSLYAIKFRRMLDIFRGKKFIIKEHDMNFKSEIKNIKFNGKIYLDGYWQSYKYFMDCEKIIQKDLIIKKEPNLNNLGIKQKIVEKTHSICVHIRYFDEAAGVIDNSNIGYDYYRDAIKICEERYKEPCYFVFSDRPEKVREKITLPEGRFYYVDINKNKDDAIWDLWLMQHCNGFIIANSTFSWWAAWLSGSEYVIAPKKIINGVAAWGFDGLLPDHWIKV